MTGRQKFEYLAITASVTIAMGYFSMFIFGMCIASFVSNPRKHYDSLIALIFTCTVSSYFYFPGMADLVLSFFSSFYNCLWPWAPTCFMHSIISPVSHSAENNEWAYEKAAMESSSYMVMNPVMAWLTGNIGYHHIHHLNSKIPFYRLPEVMATF